MDVLLAIADTDMEERLKDRMPPDLHLGSMARMRNQTPKVTTVTKIPHPRCLPVRAKSTT